MMNPVTRDNTNKILISSARGSLSCLRRELIDLGYPVVEETPAGIETEGTLDDTMELNLYLRTGQRVLYMLQQISVKTVDDFYKKIRELNWEQYIPSDGYLCVTSSVDSPLISDSRFAHQKCKDAIVDRIKDKRGRRPDSGPKKDGTVVFLYWKKDTVGIYLDTSGEPLSKRGYRTEPLRAPMQGTLAASVVMATGWNGNSTFINPMCGSGTLAIEAALMAMRKPPRPHERQFRLYAPCRVQQRAMERITKESREEHS